MSSVTNRARCRITVLRDGRCIALTSMGHDATQELPAGSFTHKQPAGGKGEKLVPDRYPTIPLMSLLVSLRHPIVRCQKRTDSKFR